MAATSKAGTAPWRSFRALQVCLGLLLLTAAGLKTHQLATEPVLETGILNSRWFLIAVVQFELFFGIWLVSGLFPVVTSRTTIALFAAFSLISLYKALSSEVSCGCFGRVEVNPWYTLTLDALFIVGLLYCRPQGRAVSPGVHTGRGLRLRLASVLVAWLCAGMSSGVVMASYQSTRDDDVGQILGDGRTVLLEPDTWVGKRFPLLDWIEIDASLDRGRWFVVLHRPGCAKCKELLRQFGELDGTDRLKGAQRLALVSVEGVHRDAVSATPKGASFFAGVLNRRFEWFLSTPTRIVLEQGNVVAVDSPDPR